MAERVDELLEVPEWLAKRADARAWEIFQSETNMGRSVKECLGQVYMMGIKAAWTMSAPSQAVMLGKPTDDDTH